MLGSDCGKVCKQISACGFFLLKKMRSQFSGYEFIEGLLDLLLRDCLVEEYSVRGYLKTSVDAELVAERKLGEDVSGVGPVERWALA
jgi:hypothetical protein